ncbi:MAG: SOS response-associated peptidase [Planctomycetota bacterium]|jgi:putative SOS response-associated peptidase YedK
MCGRYTLATPDPDLADLLDLTAEPTLEPRYNIAPTQPVAVLRTPQVRPVRELELLQWGLVPSWAKDPTIGARMINARSETAAEKPSFRAAFRQRRCLLPADGFYEWQRIGRGKQPHYIRMKGGRPFVFAGLWEHWEGPDGTVIESCTVLTTTPNELIEPLHNRMPVILRTDDSALWLDPEVKDPARIQPLLRPYEAAEMTSHPVSTQVNNPRNDEGGCIQPL